MSDSVKQVIIKRIKTEISFVVDLYKRTGKFGQASIIVNRKKTKCYFIY